ncbi:hypothetical protein HPB48_005131 [Haemaphysalis longicornis]|uniref:Transposase Helix-turn-helix domain-containing protein n=1 Tax=Haemaphysalis longicornis TaxID=44386 RepID=A0A9J6FIK6_HAELO|nr:hypothetical protein HPB48_005131 [Haemaphysalis longicornis]
MQSINADSQQLSLKIQALEKQKQQLEVMEDSLRNNDAKVLFYTGIANFGLLMAIFQLIEVVVKHTWQNGLAKFQEFLVVFFLLKLKRNFPLQDLAFKFGISVSTVSRILEKW